jgi:hypothetical protein
MACRGTWPVSWGAGTRHYGQIQTRGTPNLLKTFKEIGHLLACSQRRFRDRHLLRRADLAA